MVLPLAVDLEKALCHPFVAQAELLHHTTTGRVAGDDRHLDPVQAQRLECELQDHHYRLGDEAGAGHLLVDPVTDGPVLERTPLDGRQGDLTAEPPFDEDAEPEAAPQLALPFAHPAAGGEAGLILRCQGRTLRPGLPGDQPRPATGTHGEPGLVVALDQGGQADPPPGEFEGSHDRCAQAGTHQRPTSTMSGSITRLLPRVRSARFVQPGWGPIFSHPATVHHFGATLGGGSCTTEGSDLSPIGSLHMGTSAPCRSRPRWVIRRQRPRASGRAHLGMPPSSPGCVPGWPPTRPTWSPWPASLSPCWWPTARRCSIWSPPTRCTSTPT